jgi:hypothetical protein
MKRDERDLLDVLKAELGFLARGGYARRLGASWRAPLIFEDSPSCINYGCKKKEVPCSECVLLQLVPPEFREEAIPCRFVMLTAAGETLDSLYRSSHHHEIETTLVQWLQSKIAELEAEKVAPPSGEEPLPPQAESAGPAQGVPLHSAQEPKCANPACGSALTWMTGGKFFRFRPDGPTPCEPDSAIGNIHRVKHYWLCQRCAHIYALVYEEGFGVALRPVAAPH